MSVRLGDISSALPGPDYPFSHLEPAPPCSQSWSGRRVIHDGSALAAQGCTEGGHVVEETVDGRRRAQSPNCRSIAALTPPGHLVASAATLTNEFYSAPKQRPWSFVESFTMTGGIVASSQSLQVLFAMPYPRSDLVRSPRARVHTGDQRGGAMTSCGRRHRRALVVGDRPTSSDPPSGPRATYRTHNIGVAAGRAARLRPDSLQSVTTPPHIGLARSVASVRTVSTPGNVDAATSDAHTASARGLSRHSPRGIEFWATRAMRPRRRLRSRRGRRCLDGCRGPAGVRCRST